MQLRDSNIGLFPNKDTLYHLQEAALVGNVEVAKLLLDSHADVNAQNPITGKTALVDACKKGHFEIICFLIGGEQGFMFHLQSIKMRWEASCIEIPRSIGFGKGSLEQDGAATTS